ncbi:MAG: hypothetical protein BRC36_08985 [Cyanobacteria bacterium QH_2_48_84]|nr:MAG: hypothetical protein BRC36_08985 [Cyanobacteria bacterium QH_2_48_84]
MVANYLINRNSQAVALVNQASPAALVAPSSGVNGAAWVVLANQVTITVLVAPSNRGAWATLVKNSIASATQATLIVLNHRVNRMVGVAIVA